MAAAAGAPSLSALLAWPTDHLTEAASHWDAVSENSYGLAHRVWRDAASVDWHGEAAQALRAATHADLQTTSAAVDQLQAAARVARSGVSDLHAARSRVRYAVEDIQAAGFEVGEDLSVTDSMTGGSAAQRAARQAAAQAFAADIRQRAAHLVGLDAQVAGKITTAMAGIGDTFPRNSAFIQPPQGFTGDGVRAVPLTEMRDPTGTGEGANGVGEVSGGGAGMGGGGFGGGGSPGRGAGGGTPGGARPGAAEPPKAGPEPPAQPRAPEGQPPGGTPSGRVLPSKPPELVGTSPVFLREPEQIPWLAA
ncbi:hypothetical protein [Mycobacterium colombiense]|uniref:hypothetical protein n=1 Tax=Mycobacterium colombiense TaxID=339268 RepID=UPI001F0CCED3|nr:hypothetical protein [Mycobacterium colombiense]